MMDKQPPVNINIPDPKRTYAVDWCKDHWAELMHALQDRNLGDKIAADKDELATKLARGEVDPCYEATMVINIAGLGFFTPEVMVSAHKGCPICAFKDVIGHVADQMALKYTEQR